MVLAKRPGRAWRLGMLCGRAGGQERCAFDASVDNEDLHLVSSFDSICSREKTPREKKAGGSDGLTKCNIEIQPYMSKQIRL